MSTQMDNYYIPCYGVGETVVDLLGQASKIRFNDDWWDVLGYDETDDTLCAANHIDPMDDWIITHASETFTYRDIKIDVNVFAVPQPAGVELR